MLGNVICLEKYMLGNDICLEMLYVWEKLYAR